jgi:hypothetical protein
MRGLLESVILMSELTDTDEVVEIEIVVDSEYALLSVWHVDTEGDDDVDILTSGEYVTDGDGEGKAVFEGAGVNEVYPEIV